MRVLRQLTINDERLEKFPFKRELSMQAYLMENEEILNLNDIYYDVQIYDEEIFLEYAGKDGKNGRTDLIASYASEYIAIIELKKNEINQCALTQLEGYLAQRKNLLEKTKDNPILENTKPNWIGVLIGDSICQELENKISSGYLFDEKIPIAALTIERFKGRGNTYVITDLYFKNKSKSKNRDKYKFFNMKYGKGRLVLAVIKQYVRDNPIVTLAELNSKFTHSSRKGIATVVMYKNALEFASKNRKRHFINSGDIIKLNDADGTEIAVSDQWGIGDMPEFIKKAKELNYKIETVKPTD